MVKKIFESLVVCMSCLFCNALQVQLSLCDLHTALFCFQCSNVVRGPLNHWYHYSKYQKFDVMGSLLLFGQASLHKHAMQCSILA